MLQLFKNDVVTGIAKKQVEIRQLEIDWYCTNYSTITGQAAMLAGFAFSQLTTPIPKHHAPGFTLELSYMFLTCATIGFELSAIIASTFLSVWGPGLALRGQHGTQDAHKAIDVLRDYQAVVFAYFIAGWIVFFASSILSLWIYFKHRIAMVVTFPMTIFIVLICWYSYDLTVTMRVPSPEAVIGKIDAIEAYEHIGDLDRHLTQGHADSNAEGFCPIIEPGPERRAYTTGHPQALGPNMTR